MDKVTKEIKRKRMTGEACKEEGNFVAKGKARMLKNSEGRKEVKADIRNWFKKNEPVDNVNIHQKFEEEVDGHKREETGVEIVDLSEKLV